jgi:vacuolar-type H+-ATPase subunit H
VQARGEAEKEFKQAVKKADDENREFLKKNSEKVDSIVQEIIKLIITPEYDRE